MIDWKVLWCLIHNEARHLILKQVREEHFTAPLSKEVFLLCKNYIEKGYTLELPLILSQIPEAEQYLEPVDTVNYQAYIDKIDDDLFKRSKISLGVKLQNESVTKEEFLDEVNNFVQTKIYGNRNENVVTMEDYIDSFYEKLRKPVQGIDGIATYIEPLDKQLNGLKPGNYVVVAGRPSMGKSALMCWLAYQNASRNIPTLVFSLEMNKDALLCRMLSASLRIPLHRIYQRRFTPEEVEKIRPHKEILRNMPLTIDETSGICIEQMEATIAEASMKNQLGLIILDYVQIMSGHTDDENQRLSRISMSLKTMAKKYKVPIVALSQLNRVVELREDKHPMLSDLRGSGTLEQDADIVLMLYRHYYYNHHMPEIKDWQEILIRKFREGQVGAVDVEYVLETQEFKPLNPKTKLYEFAKKLHYKE